MISKFLPHGTVAIALMGLTIALGGCKKSDAEPPAPTTPTGGSPSVTSVTDIDGNVYRVVKIGDQYWMAENLRTARYANGDPIPNVTNGTLWPNLTTGAWCWHGNDAQHDSIYGKLYNWFAGRDIRGLCPTGWHVPTSAEWMVMVDLLGGLNVAGGKLKSQGNVQDATGLWPTGNNATNESGFTGHPGGHRITQGTFQSLGTAGYWLSSMERNTLDFWSYQLSSTSNGVTRASTPKPAGQCVRCLKD